MWSATLTWSPTASTRLSVARYRELKAHLDAESDHFVASGARATATWFPVAKLGLALSVESEEQRYIGAGFEESVEPREDTPFVGGVRLQYTPRERASFELAYREENRASNRARFDYDSAAVTLAGEIKF